PLRRQEVQEVWHLLQVGRNAGDVAEIVDVVELQEDDMLDAARCRAELTPRGGQLDGCQRACRAKCLNCRRENRYERHREQQLQSRHLSHSPSPSQAILRRRRAGDADARGSLRLQGVPRNAPNARMSAAGRLLIHHPSISGSSAKSQVLREPKTGGVGRLTRSSNSRSGWATLDSNQRPSPCKARRAKGRSADPSRRSFLANSQADRVAEAQRVAAGSSSRISSAAGRTLTRAGRTRLLV